MATLKCHLKVLVVLFNLGHHGQWSTGQISMTARFVDLFQRKKEVESMCIAAPTDASLLPHGSNPSLTMTISMGPVKNDAFR